MANPVEKRSNIGRIPTIPMDYNNNDKSVKGELMIDWENRTLFAKTLDGQIIHIGEPQINIEISQKLGVGFTYGIHPLPMRWEFDTRCINFINKVVQLRDYNTAESLTVPFKDSTGVLNWMNRYEIGASSMVRAAKTINKGNNNMVVLIAGTFNKSKNLEGHVDIKLPTNLSESYNRIVWRLTTNENIDFSFPDFDVSWEYNNDPFKANTTRTYEFETWDNGTSWTGKYINNEGTQPSWEYDKENYFTKDEIQTSSSWKYPDDDTPQGVFNIVCVKTQKEYDDLIKDNNTFYFVENSSEVYRGENNFSNHFEVVNSFNVIDPIIRDRIYINKSNFEMRYYDGTNWNTLSRPITEDMSIENTDDFLPTKIAVVNYIKSLLSTVIDDKNKDKIPVGTAVIDYIESIASDIVNEDNDSKLATIKSIRDYLNDASDFVITSSYENGILSFTHNLKENNEKVLLSDVIIGFDVDIKNEKIIVKTRKDLESKDLVEAEFNLPPHIKDGYIDLDNEKIILNLTDKTTIDINIDDLLARIVSSKSGFVNSPTLKITIDPVSGSNMGNIRISEDPKNMVSIKNTETDKGLFVDPCIKEFTDQKGNRIVLTNELEGDKLTESEFRISKDDAPDIDDDVKIITKTIISDLIRKATNIFVDENNIIQFILDADHPELNGFYVTLDKSTLDKFNILYKFEEGTYQPHDIMIIAPDGGKVDSGYKISAETSDFYLNDEDTKEIDEEGNEVIIPAKSNTVVPTVKNVKNYVKDNTTFIKQITETDEEVNRFLTDNKKFFVTYLDMVGEFNENILSNNTILTDPGNLYLTSQDIGFEEPIIDPKYGDVYGILGDWNYYISNDDNSLNPVNIGDTLVKNKDYLFRATFTFPNNSIIKSVKDLNEHFNLTSDNTVIYERYLSY